jgi:hypothetical protein
VTPWHRWFARLDRWLLTHHPLVWARSLHSQLVGAWLLPLCALVALWVAGQAITTNRMPKDLWTLLFMEVFVIFGAALAMLPSAALLLPTLSKGASTIPAELLPTPASTKRILLFGTALSLAPALLVFALVEKGLLGHVGRLATTGEIVQQIKTVNDAAAACCAVHPASAACRERARLPLSNTEERLLASRGYSLSSDAAAGRGREIGPIILEAAAVFGRYGADQTHDAPNTSFDRAFLGHDSRSATPRSADEDPVATYCYQTGTSLLSGLDARLRMILVAQGVYPDLRRHWALLPLDILLVCLLLASLIEGRLSEGGAWGFMAGMALTAGRYGAASVPHGRHLSMAVFGSLVLIFLSACWSAGRRRPDRKVIDRRNFFFACVSLLATWTIGVSTSPVSNLYLDRLVLAICAISLYVSLERRKRDNLWLDAIPSDARVRAEQSTAR